jgi:kynurenine formamidase
MKNTIYLSYYINSQTPLYGGEQSIFIEKRGQISNGDSSNTKYLKLPNHTGTHIDFPYHFSNEGKNINNYPASFWFFNNVHTLSYKAKREEIIDENVIDLNVIPKNTDFLIIDTDFGRFRNDKEYWNNNPGLAPSLACALKKQCPNLRVVGFDFISVSSYQNRLLGRKAHKVFLLENDILIVEDMKLDKINNRKINTIVALPLLIDKIDGGPITIIANSE